MDSFENPEYYLCVQDKDNSLKSNTNGQYILIQKSSYPGFSIQDNDYVIYYGNNGEIACNKASEITGLQTTDKFYAANGNSYSNSGFISENQIIGKIVKVIDNNIWNSVSIKIWETSIHSINIKALLANN